MTHEASSLRRTESVLAAIQACGDEGARIFTRLYTAAALDAARAADARAAHGITLGPLDGRLVSIKDLFDVAGEPTTAGSAVLRDATPAEHDAVVVRRLRAAGAIILGKTNMTEFAFSGIGFNPHYGTPGNARNIARIPGGSSSGAGVSVARGFCDIAIGTDTGGSVRIPAAFNGVCGFKPTQARVPRTGAYPLSFTLDTVGPLACSVADCARADAVLNGTPWPSQVQRSISGLRVGVPRGLLFTQCEDEVSQTFETALAAIAAAGARIRDLALDDWMGAPFRLQEQGTLIAAEAAHIHADVLACHPETLDPLVLGRIRRGQTISAAHYVGVQQARAQWQASLDAQIEDIDVLLLPSVPFVAPRIEALREEGAFTQANLLALRNPSVFNFYDLPALSLPLRREPEGLPVGMMAVGRRGQDHGLLAIGTALQTLHEFAS